MGGRRWRARIGSPRVLPMVLPRAVSLVLLAVFGGLVLPSEAQIRPDPALRNPSRVRRQGATRIITGGTQVGNNLFHSFAEFSIPDQSTASFRGLAPDLANVFARVTGSSASRINGMLEALQTDGSLSSANFFLLNPNGILFGRNASLRLGGSFMATTAERIRFADGTEFGTATPQRFPLLTVSVPVGLQFGPNPGLIRNQSQSNLVRDSFGDPIAGGLQVETGRTLALIGGDLEIAGGFLMAPAGRVELGSVAGRGSVGWSTTATGWQVNQGGAKPLGAIRFSRSAIVDASGASGGGIQLWAAQIDLSDETLILSDTLGDLAGQEIRLRATDLSLDNFSLINAGTSGSGNGGNIRVNTQRLTATTGGQISTRTTGAGNAGHLYITAREQIQLDGSGSILEVPTGLFTQTAPGSAGQGGRINLATPELQLRASALIATDTSGAGQAGTIRIEAKTVSLSGVFRDPSGEVVLDQGLPYPTGIFADSNATATAPGGAIFIQAQRLHLDDGAVLQTNAEGTGDAGNLTLRATEAITLSGTAAGRTPTTIFAASGGLPGAQGGGTATATGRGGTLSIQTPRLTVENGAVIAVSSLNPDQQAAGAGNLNIQADRVSLSNRGRLVAETASGDGGNINLQLQDQLVLRNNSQISTSAGIEGRGGDGGNIAIGTDFILTAPAENSDIRANAFTGRGGNVTITAEGILGIAPRQRPTDLSDITASSEFGTPGEIIIRSPDVEPSTRAPELATTPLSDRPAQGCEIAHGAATAEFFATGQGGVPIGPDEPLSSSDILADIRWPAGFDQASLDQTLPHQALADQTLTHPSPTPPEQPSRPPSGPLAKQPVEQPFEQPSEQPSRPPIVEAQGWTLTDQGAVMLVAEVPSPIHPCALR